MNELYRNKLFKLYGILNNIIKENRVLCTMEHSVDICKLPFKKANKNRKYKMPKLCELHLLATGKDPVHAHTADSDVISLLNILHSNYLNIDNKINLLDILNDKNILQDLDYINNLNNILNKPKNDKNEL